MRDIQASIEVVGMIGAENLDRLRDSPEYGPFICWHCGGRGDANTEPVTVIAELGPRDGYAESTTVIAERDEAAARTALAHAECSPSQAVSTDAATTAALTELGMGAGHWQTLLTDLPVPNGHLPTQNGQPPTPDGYLPTLDGRVPTSSGRLPTPDGCLPTLDGRVPTLSGQLPTSDGFLPLLTLDVRPEMAVRGGPGGGPDEQVTRWISDLRGMGLTPVTTISEQLAQAMDGKTAGTGRETWDLPQATGWRFELSGRRVARLTAADGSVVWGREFDQPFRWRMLATRTNRCVVLIGAIGLYPTADRPSTRITTLLEQAAQAGELVAGVAETGWLPNRPSRH